MGKTKDTSADLSGPMWTRIADEIAAAVGAGAYPPGSVLPSASELASRYGVNRHTVRQALLHLQGLGLVAVERGRGTTVVGARFPYRIGRRVSLRANFAPTGMDVSGELLSTERRPASEAEALILGIEPGDMVWDLKTRSRAAGLVVSAGAHILECRRFLDFPDRLSATRASISAAFRTYGIEDYVRFSTRLSADLPTPDEAALLEIDASAPVMRSRAVDGLPDGSPLQALDSLFLGSRVEMLVELAG
jgi:GntR family phosphonate transport system transcriptional regulator